MWIERKEIVEDNRFVSLVVGALALGTRRACATEANLCVPCGNVLSIST